MYKSLCRRAHSQNTQGEIQNSISHTGLTLFKFYITLISVIILSSCQGQKMKFVESDSKFDNQGSSTPNEPGNREPASDQPQNPIPTIVPEPPLPTLSPSPTSSAPQSPIPSPILIPSPTEPPSYPIPPTPTPSTPSLPTQTPTPTPPIPPPTPTPSPIVTPTPPAPTPSPLPSKQPVPDPALKAGICNTNGQALLSCLSCDFPPPPPPTLSAKAQRLAEIMWKACNTPNASDPTGYVPPTRTQMYDKVSACSPTAYPDTPLSTNQAQTINLLMTNAQLNKLLFTGAWYHRPYTEHFEYYFGLDNREARYTFCNGTALTGMLITKEYIDECALAEDNCWSWSQNPQKVEPFNAAQNYRKQLIACMKISKGSPTAPKPPTPQCNYKSFEGYYDIGGREFVNDLLSQGYKIALETPTSCSLLNAAPLPKFAGPVKMVGYKCQ